ncbi:MAG: hypothetical protein J6L62_05535 [Clostridia bacterium]|nr:hypothetical protein [Clostridia bacterium]
MNKNESCLNCRYYTDDIGDKGYCKLYRHNTASPDVACPKFEKKETKERKDTQEAEKVKGSVLSELSKNKYKASVNKGLLISSVVCTAVLSILLLIFSATICVTFATAGQVSLLHRVIFIVLVAAFVISLIVVVCMLLSRFKVMRIIITAVSIVIVVVMLIFSDRIWFDFYSLVIVLSETLFNI